jgi:hypothetical protein
MDCAICFLFWVDPLEASTTSLPTVLRVIGPERKKRSLHELKFLWKKATFRQILLRRIEMQLSKGLF